MQAPFEATLLRIFLREDDVFRDKLLCEQLVHKARAMGLAGASVTRGILGYGPKIQEPDFGLAHDRPVVLEVVESDDKIQSFLSAVEAMIESGLITLQRVTVVRYGRAMSRGLESADRSAMSVR
jgi:PII-like signaling protein